MDNSFKSSITNPEEEEKKTSFKDVVKGKITDFLGEGENAEKSIASIVLIACFIVGTLISGAVGIWDWKVDDIVKVWGIFTPIITLALGYALGKGNNK